MSQSQSQSPSSPPIFQPTSVHEENVDSILRSSAPVVERRSPSSFERAKSSRARSPTPASAEAANASDPAFPAAARAYEAPFPLVLGIASALAAEFPAAKKPKSGRWYKLPSANEEDEDEDVESKQMKLCSHPACEFCTTTTALLNQHRLQVHAIPLPLPNAHLNKSSVPILCGALNCAFTGFTKRSMDEHRLAFHQTPIPDRSVKVPCGQPLCPYASASEAHIARHKAYMHPIVAGIIVPMFQCDVAGCASGKGGQPYSTVEKSNVRAHQQRVHKIPKTYLRKGWATKKDGVSGGGNPAEGGGGVISAVNTGPSSRADTIGTGVAVPSPQVGKQSPNRTEVAAVELSMVMNPPSTPVGKQTQNSARKIITPAKNNVSL